MSIEGIALENFSALPQTNINPTTLSRQRHAVFHYFYLMIANNILPLLLQTASSWFHWLKTKNYWQHIWVKYGETLIVVLKICMCLYTIHYVSYVSVLWKILWQVFIFMELLSFYTILWSLRHQIWVTWNRNENISINIHP